MNAVRQAGLPARPSKVTIAIAILVAAMGVQHLVQAIMAIRGSGDPQLLILEHLDVTIFALVAAYAMWRGKRWAAWALAIAGAGVAVLIISLGPLLNMDSVERSGLWVGAGGVAAFTALGVWYLSRTVRRGA